MHNAENNDSFWNKFSDRSIGVLLLVLLGDYDRPTNHTTVRPMDMRGMSHREVTLPITCLKLAICSYTNRYTMKLKDGHA